MKLSQVTLLYLRRAIALGFPDISLLFSIGGDRYRVTIEKFSGEQGTDPAPPG